MKKYFPKEIEDKINLYMLRTAMWVFEFGEPEDMEFIKEENETFEELKKRLSDKLEILNNKKIKSIEILDKNLDELCEILKLNEIDRDILEFAILIDHFSVLEQFFFRIEIKYKSMIFELLSVVLNRDKNEVKNSLNMDSPLMLSEIFTIEMGVGSIVNFFGFNYSNFTQDMLFGNKNLIEVFKSTFKKSIKSHLSSSDFRYLNIDIDVLKDYIKASKKGTNILLYGLPGTGKTEFAKVIANEVGKTIYEISYTSRYTPINYSGEKRFCSLKLADKILSSGNNIIVFDEIEDIFKSNERISKAFINNTLESNNLPTFWITNDINEIDNAYIRRFDMIIEFKIPPKKQRAKILKYYTKNMISDKVLKKLSKNRAISPALITSATKVIATLDKNRDKVFKNLIKNSLKAQGPSDIGHKKDITKVEMPKTYDIKFINSNLNLDEIYKGLKEFKSAKILIHGLPGTGKSAYAKFLAKKLKKELVFKKASDLLDCYVGNSEKNIANAFKEASSKKGILVFDEVDTFLQDRAYARNKYEISQVNEMLVQMENFKGIFIATTNLSDVLDKASLRRFDIKLEFGYLKPKQAKELLKEECLNLQIDINSKSLAEIESLTNLTPGDFATVISSNKFNKIKNSDEFVARLMDEIKYKKIENKIGF